MSPLRRSEKAKALGRVPLFRDASTGDLETIAALTTEATYAAGTVLAEQGAIGREAMVVVDGTARVLRDGTEIAVVEAGHVVGEMSILVQAPRNATVVASTDVTVLIMSAREFDKVLETDPAIAVTILRTVVQRLAATQIDGLASGP